MGGVTVEPVFLVRARWVSGPQGYSIPTVDQRESMPYERQTIRSVKLWILTKTTLFVEREAKPL